MDFQDGSDEQAKLAQDQGLETSPGTGEIALPNGQNVVTLPPGTTIEALSIDGRDLVIELDNGARIVVPDGAVYVPQIVAEGVAIPPLNIAQLLTGNEPEPAAGNVRSSGGNFADDEGAIQDAFDLGNLLPFTDFGFPEDREEEILPGIATRDPEIVIQTADNPSGVQNATASVDEEGLPARNDGEPAGTNAAANSETTTGTIVFAAPDGLSAVLINGVAVNAVGQTFTTPLGTLTITSLDLANGVIGFSYTLEDNLIGGGQNDFFEVSVVDVDGDQADATLTVAIVDDGPIAANDLGIVPAGSLAPITGDVLVNDVPGADGYATSGAVASFARGTLTAEPGSSIQGEYGVLTVNADGTYSYTRDPNTPGGVEESFTYTIVDQDGSTSTATLVIRIEDSPASIDFVPGTGDGTLVDEAALPPRGPEPVGSSEGADNDPNNNSDPNEATGSTIRFTSPDGIGSVTINGVVVSNGGLPVSIITDSGTLLVTDFQYDPITGEGSITYEFTLADNTSGDDTAVDFTIVVTDLDGDSDSDILTINIADDVPEAAPDSDVVTEDLATSASGNVITDAEANGDNGADTQGADGVLVTGVAAGVSANPVSGSVGTIVAGTYGTITIGADGSYTYALNNDDPRVQGLDGTENLTDAFTYTITDGDGDAATTTITIRINGNDDPVVINGLDGAGAEEVVDEDNLADGSSPNDSALTQSGTFTIASPDGLAALSVGGTTIFGSGVTYPVTVSGSYGQVRITSVNTTTDADGDVVSAVVTYEYILGDNTLDHSAAGEDALIDSFAVVATDSDGSNDTASLDIQVIDDVPTANPDADSVTEDGPLVADGNVLTGTGGSDANATDGASDVRGADGANVTGVAFGSSTTAVSGNVGTGVAGAYGSITIDAAGNYVYTLDNGNPFVQGLDGTESLTEVFTYTITDGDGDTSTTTILVTINGSDDPVVINGLDLAAPEVILDEDDLPGGSDTTPESLTRTGSFTIDSPDGLTTLTVGGVTVFTGAATTTYPVVIDDPTYGILTITGVATTTDVNGDIVSATVTYSYTLDDNSLRHDAADQDSFTDSFEVVATDTDGSTDTASLDIRIVDDVPTATDDTVIQAAENQSIIIDALANDVFGADGVDTSNAAKVFVSTAASQGSVTYDPATGQFTYVPVGGAGSNGNLTDFFEYTIVDADGDTSTARVNITLKPDSEPVGSETTAALDDDGLPGNNPLSTLGDLDANADDDPSDTSEASYTGVLPFDVGNDTPAAITFEASLNGSLATIGQETVTYEVIGNVLTATVTGGPRDGTDLFTITITDPATGAYTVKLLANVIHTPGSNENNAFASIDFTVTDSDDDTTVTNLGIAFNDDAPTATANANSVEEGKAVTGNVVTDDDGSGVDAAGADGYADEGPVIDAGFSSSNPAGVTLLNKAVAADGTITLTTSIGTLVIQTSGEYSFTSSANTINADTAVTFTYTIEDGDGDQVTAELLIDIGNVAGKVSDNNAIVYEAALATGSDPASTGELFATGQITVEDATGPFVFELTDLPTGNFGTLTLNTDGTYSYLLTSPIDGDLTGDGGNNGNNPINDQESFGYVVKDLAGNIIGTGIIEVTIVDDVPEVDIARSMIIPGVMITQDADTLAGPDTATSNVSAAFTIVTEEYGADKPGTLDITYAMTLLVPVDGVSNDSGLDSDGNSIFLYQLADGTIVGSTATTAPADTSDPSVVFSISVSSTSGVVTLTQFGEIDHDDNNDTSAPYDDQLADLASGFIGVTATAVITDGDGDIDTDSELFDLAGYVRFADDGPAIDITVADNDTVMLVTQDAETRGTAFDTASSTANFSDTFQIDSSSYGADGPGTTVWSFSLEIANAVSGLSSDGAPITLYLVDGVVVGSTAGAPADAIDLQDDTGVVFAISTAADGTVTLTQYAELDHPDNNDTSAPYDDQLLALANGIVNLVGTATITDGDFDEASETLKLDLGGNVKFADDGPSILNLQLGAGVDVDETPGLPQTDTSLAPVVTFTSDFGADGPGTTTFSLSIVDPASGLRTAVGDYLITLTQDTATPNLITGIYNDGTGDKTAFTITINANGTLTITQSVALEHEVDGPEGPAHNDFLDLAGKINAVVTLEDGDFDEASAAIDIGGAIQFFDDGPSVTLSAINDSLTVSDTDLGFASENFADNFIFDGGEDGTASTAYKLSTTDGAFSGLYDNATNEQVLLRENGGLIEGYTATTNLLVFTVSVTSGGQVTLDLARAIDHALSSNSNGSTATLVSDDLIQLTTTITDNDGDTDSQALNIGQNLNFTDDVPTAEPTLVAYLDDDTQGGNPNGPDDRNPDEENLTGTLVDPAEGFGNDGGTVSFDIGSTLPAGFRLVVDPLSDGVIIEQLQGTSWVPVVTVSLDGATGAYTISQTSNILHEDDGQNDENEVTFVLGATLTDGDTDTALTSLTIVVDDDTPTTGTGSTVLTVDEDGIANGIDDNGTNDAAGEAATVDATVTGDFSAGADGPLTYAFDPALANLLPTLFSGGVQVSYSVTANAIVATAGGSPVFTVTLNGVSPGSFQFVLQGPLDHADTDDSENVTDIDINFGPLITATDADGDTITNGKSFIIRVDDDSPRANPDTDALTEDDTSTTGDVILGTGTTSGAAGADESGADGFADPVVKAISGFNGPGVVGGDTVGQWGTLVLNNNGTYTYTPNNAALQGLDTGEFETDTFTYTIEDKDGDAVSTTLTITINGVNDAPVANPDTNFIIEDGTSPITGNVLQDVAHGVAPDGFARADTADSDVDGEDIDVAAADAGIINLTYGVLTLDAETGAYSYRLYTEAENKAAFDAVQALNVGDKLTDTHFYNAFDGTAESNETTLTISIFGSNDAPKVVGSLAAVSDEGLTNGNQDSVGNPTDTTDSFEDSGQISITDIDSSSFVVTLGTPSTPGLTSGGLPINWQPSTDGKTLVGSTTAGNVILIAIDDSGNWTVDLIRQIDHGDAASEDVYTFDVPVSVSDGTATTMITDGIRVSLEDDSPVVFDPDDGSVVNNDSPATPFDLNYSTAVGGDGLGNVVFSITDGDLARDQANNPLSFNGEALFIYGDGTNTLTARTADGDIGFTIVIEPLTDRYVVDLRGTISNGSELSVSNLTSAAAGNTQYRTIGADNATNNASNIDIILSARSADGSRGDINTNTSNIGVDAQNIRPNAAVRIDLVNDAQTDTTPPIGATGFQYAGHQDVVRFEQTIPTINGNPDNTVTIKVTAIDADDDQDLGYSSITPEAGEAFVNINTVTVTDSSAGTFYTFAENGTVTDAAGNPVTAASTGFAVTFTGASVIIGGLDDGDQYEIIGDGAFSAVLVESASASNARFDLGIFNVTTLNTGDPIGVAYDVIGTDRDLDSVLVTDAIAVTFTPSTIPTGAGPSSAGTQSIQSFSTATMMLDDSLSDFIAGNDNQQDLGGGRFAGMGFQNSLRAGQRMGELTTVAALSGAILGPQPLAAAVSDGAGPTGPDLGQSVDLMIAGPTLDHSAPEFSADPGTPGIDALSFETPDMMQQSNLASFETATSELGEPAQSVQALPNEIAMISDSGTDIASASAIPLSIDGSAGVAQAMDALLMLGTPGDGISPIASDGAATTSAVLADIRADMMIDEIIEAVSDQESGAGYLTSEPGAPDVGLLDQFMGSGVSPIAAVPMDVEQAEASAAATATA